jgi:plasmid stabilization system protein ParE
MAYRLAGLAGAQIDQILLESARRWGEERAIRYYYLILAAMSAIAADPERPGSRPIRGGAGLRVFSLRLARAMVPREHRVGQPRHSIIYRVETDGMVAVIGIAHDRMQLEAAARRMRQASGPDE